MQEKNSNIQIYRTIGLMSGSSLDGLDIAYTVISYNQETELYTYKIEIGETVEYPQDIADNLINIKTKSAFEFMKFDRYYGKFIGQQTKLFMEKHNIFDQVQFICSHGHTIFHSPSLDGFTVQIGHISNISAECKKNVIGDFRSMDVALGGQGAPLVPIGDELLFKEYQFCINFGGIANMSFHDIQQQKRIAFDVCPCNILLNYLANKLNLEYDKNGELAEKGIVNKQLLEQFQKQEWMKQQFPKSLDREYIQNEFYPIIENQLKQNQNDKNSEIINVISTVTYFIAQEISHQILQNLNNLQNNINEKDQIIIQVLCTGGGAYNQYLIKQIQQIVKDQNVQLVIPDNNLVEFKEALLFSFLGVCTIQNKNNSLKSVTGAFKDSIGGLIQYY